MILKNELQAQNVKTLLFDIDGTITQWTSVPEFLASVLKEYGLPYKDEVLAQFFRAIEWFESHNLVTSETDPKIYGAFLGECIELLKENGISGNDFRERMFAKEPDFVKVEDNISEKIEALYQKYQLYCYTNWFYAQAIKKLNKYNLTKYFQEIFNFENNYLKCNKVGFMIILGRLNLKKDELVHIGDSECDILGSKSAGVQSILLDYENKKHELYNSATAVITEFSDISRVLTLK